MKLHLLFFTVEFKLVGPLARRLERFRCTWDEHRGQLYVPDYGLDERCANCGVHTRTFEQWQAEHGAK